MPVSGGLDRRSRLDRVLEVRDEEATDPYVFTREGYRQRRRFLVHDGNPPVTEEPGDLERDLEELEQELDELR